MKTWKEKKLSADIYSLVEETASTSLMSDM